MPEHPTKSIARITHMIKKTNENQQEENQEEQLEGTDTEEQIFTDKRDPGNKKTSSLKRKRTN